MKEIDRVAFALLSRSGCDTSGIENAGIYDAMLRQKLNCPPSSGMGRLFDGVAAILGIKTRCSYEGQGAVLLEAAATEDEGVYPYTLSGSPLRFDWREMIRCIVADRDAGVETGRIAAWFMNTLMAMACEQCSEARDQTGLHRVVLSGGSFQNMYIMHRLPKLLKSKGFEVYTHKRVSANDEGISLGQLMIAEPLLNNKKEN